jgi:fatty-acyl-CoA synthase
MGAGLNTVNIRLAPEQAAYIINHAKDRVVIVDESLAEAFEQIVPQLDSVEQIVVVGDDTCGLPGAVLYEDFIAGDGGFEYPELDER